MIVKAETTKIASYAALAIAKIKPKVPFNFDITPFTLALDDIRDPGNLGTIIRIADWYGINQIICSQSCADFYNPKVIGATMGSFTRVSVTYVALPEFLKLQNTEIYGAALSGENIHTLSLKPAGILVMGNEAKGLSEEVNAQIKKYVKIPGYGQAESLNVATATAILVDNFFRNK